MAKKKNGNSEAIEKSEVTFSKEQILRSKTIPHSRDILNVVLKDDMRYSLSEVDKAVQKFKEKRVK
ncbi:hypothetical protein [Thermotalea metallivorans]|uniref:POU-specific domain-containing protein n=1 Tax=Thermotalea metallivorans TaxID=520762 RepID=A0A140LCL1_9FIRM|nr:hypothetical protein [Thermotalea metallivorans]KXG78286.1 hypothetical protein AN619_02610 [Thermotalea metallivorans]